MYSRTFPHLSLLSLFSVQDALDSDDSDADEDKYADQADMPGTKFDSKTRTTVRNLRIREDTAKYLYNLDPNSAFYDPKTRSMRENPFKNTNKESSQYAYACHSRCYSNDVLMMSFVMMPVSSLYGRH